MLNHSFACIRSMPQEEQENYTLFLLMLPVRTLPGLKAREDSPYRNQRRLVEHWLSCPSHVEQEQFIRQIMTDTTELLQQSNEPGTSSLVRQIMAIIDEQYMEQISVASLG